MKMFETPAANDTNERFSKSTSSPIIIFPHARLLKIKMRGTMEMCSNYGFRRRFWFCFFYFLFPARTSFPLLHHANNATLQRMIPKIVINGTGQRASPRLTIFAVFIFFFWIRSLFLFRNIYFMRALSVAVGLVRFAYTLRGTSKWFSRLTLAFAGKMVFVCVSSN